MLTAALFVVALWKPPAYQKALVQINHTHAAMSYRHFKIQQTRLCWYETRPTCWEKSETLQCLWCARFYEIKMWMQVHECTRVLLSFSRYTNLNPSAQRRCLQNRKPTQTSFEKKMLQGDLRKGSFAKSTWQPSSVGTALRSQAFKFNALFKSLVHANSR